MVYKYIYIHDVANRDIYISLLATSCHISSNSVCGKINSHTIVKVEFFYCNRSAF